MSGRYKSTEANWRPRGISISFLDPVCTLYSFIMTRLVDMERENKS